ncbi:MAG: aminotransferase class I/II-fold pyridoxal phosphate-dependent enzyme [Clostridiales bacterium]|nr:aminotransferase class I/II-fold pyridoxal phosphate-dependent enzyme [Clostridiales bacterium]
MISFRNDYSEGAHERVLEALACTNRLQHSGYGEDEHCRAAGDRIRTLIGQPGAAVHFLSGGTQANMTVIASILRPHQGVVAADTGHIATHETGAVEATGHKVLTVSHHQGRLQAEDVHRLVEEHAADSAFEHMVQPGMVYISNTTELGTLYTRDMLHALHSVCRQKGLPLYLDGARLGYALTSEGNDLTLQDIARCCDVFTLGLTKQGGLFGEAVVIVNPALQKDFRYHIKQRGGMLAKGWLMGLQCEVLLQDDLYFKLARRAVGLALHIRDSLRGLGVAFLSDSPSNQQFPIFSQQVVDCLAQNWGFNLDQPLPGERRAIRLCTSWATREEDVEALIGDIRRLLATEGAGAAR